MHDTFPKNISQLALFDLNITTLGGSSSTQSLRESAVGAAECIERVKTMLFNSQLTPSENRSSYSMAGCSGRFYHFLVSPSTSQIFT
jgi:hypothetical protein